MTTVAWFDTLEGRVFSVAGGALRASITEVAMRELEPAQPPLSHLFDPPRSEKALDNYVKRTRLAYEQLVLQTVAPLVWLSMPGHDPDGRP